MASAAKERLTSKIALATVLIWVCLLASAGPLLYAILRFITSFHEPEGGFVGMAILFMLIQWGVVLLFPLIGLVYALNWRRDLQNQFRKLEAEDNILQQPDQGS